MHLKVKAFLDNISTFSSLSNNTIQAYKNDLSHIQIYLNEKKINNINSSSIKDYLEYLAKLDLKKSSLNRKYSTIKRFIKYLIDKNEIESNMQYFKFPKIKNERILPKVINRNEIQMLLNKDISKDRFKNLRKNLIISILYSSGLRVSELCNLKIKDVKYLTDKKNEEKVNFISIIGKGKKERIVPIFQNCIPVLKDYLEELYIRFDKIYEKDFLFLSSNKKALNRKTILNIIKEIGNLANIHKTISPHTLRHSFATHLLEDGLDIREIQQLLGHSDISTTSIYTNVDSKKLIKIIEDFHPFSK